MARTRRTLLQRILYTNVYACPRCEVHLGWYYRGFFRQIVYWRFIFSRYSRCVSCGSYGIHRIDRRDPIDSMSRNPLGRLQFLLGAPVKKCPACRLQYYDWRPARTTREVTPY
jgi:hypothetical protein